jgi:dTDP-4-amino-4,6-dideoxygalactose transaminase
MAAILADIRPGDEVVMPSYTFASTANAFVLRGAVPVFVDIRPDTLNIDETLVEAALTPRTRAIVPVHYAGVACEMDAIMAIAEARGLMVIEDAAQGMLARYKGRALGSIGHLGCLSFHETKNIICGEGGALLVNRPSLIERAEIVREKGTNRSQFFRGEVDKYTWCEMGSSFLPGELSAAFLYAQLEEADNSSPPCAPSESGRCFTTCPCTVRPPAFATAAAAGR